MSLDHDYVDVADPTEVAAATPGRRSHHHLLLHASEDERLAQLCDWVVDGLVAGEKVVHLEVDTDPQADLVAALTDRLRSSGDARSAQIVARAVATDQLSIVGLPEEPGTGPLAQILTSLEQGWSGVRMSSRSCAAARSVGAAVYAEAERHLDQLVQHRPVRAMCQVRAADLRDPVVGLALALHPHRVGDGLVDLTADEHRIRIGGELDVSNAGLVGHVVDRWARHEATSLTLDLAGLTFVDLIGGRALLDACLPLLERDGAVVLRRPRANVVRVLGMVGLDPQIVVQAA